MNEPHLIQRLALRNPKRGDTFDGRFSCDYMGSSEFEWGALPQSLKRVCRSFANYDIFMLKDVRNFKDKRLVFICHKDLATEFEAFLRKLLAASNEYDFNFKELPFFKQAMAGEKSYAERFDAWWDLDNDAFWCFGKDIATTLWKAINATIAKKREEGKDWCP